MEELKDIKPIVTILDDSFIDGAFIGLLIICILVGAYFIYKFFRKNKKFDKRKQSVLYLKSFDFQQDDKTLAYEFTKHGYITLEEHFRDEFIKIVKQLEIYKYKKDIPKIDEELKEQMKDYIKVRIR
ncbi:MAG: hypothetical protein PHF17_00915 [Arcobacteraceae bacterium]|jgi:amino acid permease|nr:hypothetical protein [Arcobacteraceae bacterium]